ncbi:hypothetical protein GmHk_11G032792 [Glycine max]|nr:hypothetical protein GmHk_11G032792 [Glycine max]
MAPPSLVTSPPEQSHIPLACGVVLSHLSFGTGHEILLPTLTQLVVLHSAQQPILKLAHPWPEWFQLMKCLLDKGYFCREEGKMLCNAGMGMKDFNVIRTKCASISVETTFIF